MKRREAAYEKVNIQINAQDVCDMFPAQGDRCTGGSEEGRRGSDRHFPDGEGP